MATDQRPLRKCENAHGQKVHYTRSTRGSRCIPLCGTPSRISFYGVLRHNTERPVDCVRCLNAATPKGSR